MMRKTKIVCTLGPATEDVGVLARLLEAGMNVARFNMAHGTYDYHSAMIKKLRQASSAARIPVALLIDIKGPEIRTGNVVGDGSVELRIPPETQGGQRFRLRSKGLPRGQGGRGDLYAKVRVLIPKRLDAEGRKLVEQLRRYES